MGEGAATISFQEYHHRKFDKNLSRRYTCRARPKETARHLNRQAESEPLTRKPEHRPSPEAPTKNGNRSRGKNRQPTDKANRRTNPSETNRKERTRPTEDQNNGTAGGRKANRQPGHRHQATAR